MKKILKNRKLVIVIIVIFLIGIYVISNKAINKYNDEIIIYPGHGRETTLDYEKKNNYYMGVYCEK